MNRLVWILAFCVMILFLMGLVMVFNTTSAEMIDRSLIKNTHQALFKQSLYAVLGIAIGVWVYRRDYHTACRASPWLFWLLNVVLVLVLIPGIGQQINGANRWIGLGKYSLQPSEFMKVVIPLYYIHAFTARKKTLILKSFLQTLIILSIPILLILFEPDNGTAAIMLTTLVALFFITKVRWIYWGLPILIFATFAVFFASQMKHVTDRIQIYLNPELDLLGKGHQPYQAKIATGSGQFLGRGIGESLQKLNYLPEARSDYIAAIYAEEMGFLGIVVLLVVYMCIACLGFQIAQKAVDREGFYLCAILTFLICFQAFLNLGVVSGLLPSKGTNLPFFSQGGSSLIANIIAMSLILNVAKIADEKKLLTH